MSSSNFEADRPQGTNHQNPRAEDANDDLERLDDRANPEEIRRHEIQRILDCQRPEDVFQDVKRTPAQLKVAYKEMSLLIHPDKNPTQLADANAATASK